MIKNGFSNSILILSYKHKSKTKKKFFNIHYFGVKCIAMPMGMPIASELFFTPLLYIHFFLKFRNSQAVCRTMMVLISFSLKSKYTFDEDYFNKVLLPLNFCMQSTETNGPHRRRFNMSELNSLYLCRPWKTLSHHTSLAVVIYKEM